MRLEIRKRQAVAVHREHRFYDPPAQTVAGLVRRSLEMSKDPSSRGREPQAVDQAGVVEGVAEREIVGAEQRGRDPDVGLKAARKQHRVLEADEARELALDCAMILEVATHQSRSRRSRRDDRLRARPLVGQTQVVVAAKAHDRPTVESIAETLAGLERRATTSE